MDTLRDKRIRRIMEQRRGTMEDMVRGHTILITGGTGFR